MRFCFFLCRSMVLPVCRFSVACPHYSYWTKAHQEFQRHILLLFLIIFNTSIIFHFRLHFELYSSSPRGRLNNDIVIDSIYLKCKKRMQLPNIVYKNLTYDRKLFLSNVCSLQMRDIKKKQIQWNV